MIRGIRRLRNIDCLITSSISHRCVIACRLIISSISSILCHILRLILSDILGLISPRLIRIARRVLSLILTTGCVLGGILSGRVLSQIPSCRILCRIHWRRNILSLIPAGLVLSHILRLICLSRVRSRILRDILS